MECLELHISREVCIVNNNEGVIYNRGHYLRGKEIITSTLAHMCIEIRLPFIPLGPTESQHMGLSSSCNMHTAHLLMSQALC